MTYIPPVNGGRINATISGNTSGAGALVSSGTLTLAGGNNVTLSQNGNAITISAGNAGAGGGIALANSQTTYTSGTANLIEGGGAITIASTTGQSLKFSVPQTSSLSATGALSISTNGSTVSIGAPTQTVQTQNLHNVTLSGNTAGVMAQVSSGTLTLAGGNNVTLSQNGNAVTISAGAGGAAGSNTLGMSNLGNTSGTSGVISGSAVQMAFAGGNNVTLSQSINGSSGTITISAGNAGAGGGIALANSQTTYTSGTANLIEGGGAITIASTTGQSFNISVPQTSSLSATGALSISTNGSTVSIGVPSHTTLSRFEYLEGLFTSINTIVQGSLSINHLYIPFYVSGSAMKIGGSLSAATNTSATTASANMSLWMGIYTLNGSTLSLASSGSANNGFQWSHSASSTGNTSINSMRQMTVPMNVNLTPGEYWVGAVISSATTYTSAAYTLYGNNQVANAASAAMLTPIGSNTSAARDVMLFQGLYKTSTSVGPTTIVGADINNSGASAVQRANFYNVIYNATY